MTPDAELRAMAKRLREMAAAARKDVLASNYYGHDLANFAQGIDNAVGGPSGELAALFNPDVAEKLADLMSVCNEDYAGARMHHKQLLAEGGTTWEVIELCEEPDAIRHALAVARALTPQTFPQAEETR